MTTSIDHGLSEAVVARIVGVLERFPAVQRAVLFGSRAKGTHRPGSDIDLALQGDGIDWRVLGRLDEALDDLLLPYQFSLVHSGPALDPAVAAHLAKVGVVLFERRRSHAG